MSVLSTAAATAYGNRAQWHPAFSRPTRRKAQKSSGFRASGTYGHCIKDNVLMDGAVGSAHSSMTAITFLDLFFDHGSPCKGAASFVHPRKVHDRRDGVRYGRPRSRASVRRFSDIRRTADAEAETPSALFASVRHNHGQPRRREWRHGSILFDAPRSKSPSRRGWDSRDSGRDAWVLWAFIISLSWSQQQ